jgi:hypothetical protein
MAYTVKNNTKIGVMKEVTEGTYVAPAAATDFIQVLSDGVEINPSRELLERNVLGTGLGKINPRTGLKSVKGSVPCYMRAASTAVGVPESDALLESLMGTKRNSASYISGSTHTTTVINVAATAGFKVGDIVVVKQAGAYHTSPIVSLVTDTSITLLVAMASAPANAVVIEAFTTYVPANSGHPSLSVSKYVEDAVLEQATGVKVNSFSLDSFSTGKIASMKFGFEGLDFDRSLTAPPFTPSYDTSETPVILDACIWQDGVKISVNEITLSIENTIGFIQDTCDGKKASRVTARTVKGTINPYKENNSIANFTKFNTNAPFSLFVTAHNATSTAGQYKESVSFYLPNCLINELAEGDIDGVLTDAISFSANTVDGSIGEVFISVS